MGGGIAGLGAEEGLIVPEQFNISTVQFCRLASRRPYMLGVTRGNGVYVAVADLFWVCFFEFPLRGTNAAIGDLRLKVGTLARWNVDTFFVGRARDGGRVKS
jgi:hypothetical protein